MTNATKPTNGGEDQTERGVTINLALPPEVHHRLKIKAVTNGITLKEALIAAIDIWAPAS